jgi:YYY domain-containing protein
MTHEMESAETTPAATSPPMRPGRWLTTTRIVLLLPFVIAAVALGLRLEGIDWDGGSFYHPDERSIYMRADAMYDALTKAPGWESKQNHDFPLDSPGFPNPKTFFDKDSSPLNPHWFPLGSIIIYILVAVRAFILEPFMEQVRLQDLASAGRTIAAIADAGSVLLMYSLGRRLFGLRVGALASVLMAFTVMNIQVTHFYRPESFVILLAFGTFWWILNVLEKGRRQDHIFLGLIIGLTFAFRGSSAPILLPVLGTYGVLVWRDWKAHGISIRGSFWSVLPIALMASGIAFATFAILQPYALLDFHKFFGDLAWETNIARTAGQVPYTVQYVGTPRNLSYEITQSAVWALGLPLGIVAWFGLAFTVGRSFFRQHIGELMLLSWVMPLILVISMFEVKFLRYIAPVLPIMVLLGSRWLVAAYDWLKPRNGLSARMTLVAIAFVVISTVWYGLAFTSIYAQPHPGIQASQWMNENTEHGSLVLTDNHWDEGFPNMGPFRIAQLPMYESDTFQKVQKISDLLAASDYIMAYSNRPWGSIARLPDRYEYSSRYYHALFDGSLGFEITQAFARFPSFAGVTFEHDPFTRATIAIPASLPGIERTGLTFNLGWADENVVNYDHPLVLVWENVGHLSAGEIENTMLGVGEPLIPERAMLTSDAFMGQRAGGTWTDIFSEGGLNGLAPWLIWLLAVELITCLTVPLAFRSLRWLPDRGVVLARPLGLLFVSWLVWLGASVGVWSFGRTSIVLSILLLAAVSGAVFWRNKTLILGTARRQWRYLVTVEVLFIVAYFVFLMIRAANPDLWHAYRGGEKPMDLSYLTAVAKSVSFPPFDPWYAGGYINYYYFGFVPIATLMRLTGIVPAVAYNLAVPLLFAMTFTAAFSVGLNLTEALRQRMRLAVSPRSTMTAGVITAMLVAVLANLDGAVQLIQATGRVFGTGSFGQFDFWRSSRLMPGQISITEFPFWSFLFGDLHAHMISLPFQVTTVGVAANLVLSARSAVGVRQRAPGIAWLALLIGAFAAINAWDVPTYGLLATGTLAVMVLISDRAGLGPRAGGMFLLILTGFSALAYLLFLPFHQNYDSVFDGIFMSRWRTVAWHYMGIHGLLFFLTISWLAVEARRHLIGTERALRMRPLAALSRPPCGNRWLTLGLALAAVLLFVAAWSNMPTLHQWTTVLVLTAVMLVTLALATWWVIRSSSTEASVHLLLLGMLVLAFGIGIGVDFITAEHDIDRMNTVFKFYLNAWVLYSVVGGVGLWQLWATGALKWPAPEWQRYVKAAWFGLLTLLVLSAAIYPLLGTRARIADRFDSSLGLTLDGTAFQQTTVYHDPGPGNRGQEESAKYALASDAEALECIRQNIPGTAVFLEGATDQYRWTPRVALYTGNPVVVGWEWHQMQQRGAGGSEPARVRARIADVRNMYSTTSVSQFTEKLDEYAVEYIYLGPAERLYYPDAGLDKLENMTGDALDVVFNNGDVTIYKVRISGEGPAQPWGLFAPAKSGC